MSPVIAKSWLSTCAYKHECSIHLVAHIIHDSTCKVWVRYLPIHVCAAIYVCGYVDGYEPISSVSTRQVSFLGGNMLHGTTQGLEFAIAE